MNFTVIQGGKASAPATAQHASQVVTAEYEAEQLQREMLKLVVPDTGLSVLEALEEICALLEDESMEQYERGRFLCHALEKLGIHFRMANPNLELSRDGFLILAFPKMLVAAHPELSRLNPKSHANLVFG